MTSNQKITAGAALALVLAAGAGFGVARLTAPLPQADTSAEKPAAPADTVPMTADAIRQSQITVAPAASGELDSAIPASARVDALPDAEAVLTSRAAGTITRIFKRIGDPVGAGETLALVESRDASAIAADRAAAGARVALAQKQLARERGLLSQGVAPRADFETAEAALAVARADAMRANAAAGAARVATDGRSVAVVSPVAGRVTAITANLGRFVAAEAELFRVADPRRIQIVTSLPPGDAARVRTGDRVELTTSGRQAIEGRVRTMTGVVDASTRAATVVVEAGAANTVFIPGQQVQARIFASGGAAKSGVMVPQDAVQTLGDRTVVFVRTRSGFKAQAVQIGSRSSGLVGITDGLRAGQPIATANAFLLKAEIEKESAE